MPDSLRKVCILSDAPADARAAGYRYFANLLAVRGRKLPREVVGERKTLRGSDTHEQRAREAGPARDLFTIDQDLAALIVLQQVDAANQR